MLIGLIQALNNQLTYSQALLKKLSIGVPSNTITTTNSTDGSFNITMTISGNNGSSQPYALAVVNSGTGSVNTDAYTGTLSASAL